MFIANDSNYTFGQFLAVDNGDDIKAPVYSKCFTDTETLKGYRFIHDPEETDPEKCVCFSIYDDVSSEATSTAFGKDAVVSDLTSVSFRLDTKILDSGKVRDLSYYHVIVPVQNIKDDTLKYLVIKMTKEVELFPENYPYYELVSTFADAEPTSAEAPGGVTPTGTITITENDTYDVTNYASAEVNVSGGSSDFSTATVTLNPVSGNSPSKFIIPMLIDEEGFTGVVCQDSYPNTGSSPMTVSTPLYKGGAFIILHALEEQNYGVSGNASLIEGEAIILVSGDCTITYANPT